MWRVGAQEMRVARTGLMLMGITRTSKSERFGEGRNELGRLHLRKVKKSISAGREGSSSTGRLGETEDVGQLGRERMRQVV